MLVVTDKRPISSSEVCAFNNVDISTNLACIANRKKLKNADLKYQRHNRQMYLCPIHTLLYFDSYESHICLHGDIEKLKRPAAKYDVACNRYCAPYVCKLVLVQQG